IKGLEKAGHFRVMRTRIGPRKNAPNRYIPILRPRANVTSRDTPVVHDLHPPRCTDAPGVGAPVHPEPLTEPLIEPLPYGHDLHRVYDLEGFEEKRLSEEERESVTTSPDPLTECYRRAREGFGEGAAAVLAKADKVDHISAAEIADAIQDTKEL